MAVDGFGASSPAATIFEHFGFTVDHVTEVARGVAAGSVVGRVPLVDPGHQPPGLRGSIAGHGTAGSH
jgi:hypothetical protein